MHSPDSNIRQCDGLTGSFRCSVGRQGETPRRLIVRRTGEVKATLEPDDPSETGGVGGKLSENPHGEKADGEKEVKAASGLCAEWLSWQLVLV